ncbi:MAG: glycosyltransferase family 2 protein [Chloroflexi bacterium]|nr:glycosyltransferase family 2 protein [Chloroflexota bacterium]OJV91110.1 MAG: hypothetical protein BGO39_26325 [Chloroflexi bacterium 54-19]
MSSKLNLTDATSPEVIPSISAVISTRNRGDRILAAVESILDNTYPNFDLWIIDQSDDNSTEEALKPFSGDSRLHYLKSDTRGCSAGRNLAISSTTSEFVAITDDDCVASPDWLSKMVAAFKTDKRIGVVSGNVTAGEHDATQGHITTYIRPDSFLATKVSQKSLVHGITANMGVRRSAWEKVSGFDPMLGVGAPLRSASEPDFLIKMLLAGYYVYETPAVLVVHYGFRNWQDYRKLLYQYSYGNGAAIAKYFKERKLFILSYFWSEFFGKIVYPLLKNIVTQRRLAGTTRLKAFSRGFVTGLFTPLDRTTGNFYPKSSKSG